MKNLPKLLAALVATVATFLLYQLGVKIESLMTIHTEFYYQFHFHMSIIASVTLGLIVWFSDF